MEQVHECQSPLFLAVEVEPPAPDEAVVHLFFDGAGGGADHPRVRRHPARGPGRAEPAEVLAVPDDAPYRFGLAEAVCRCGCAAWWRC